MKTSEALKTLYDKELKEQLSFMETDRKYVKTWRSRAITAFVAAVCFIIILLINVGTNIKHPIFSGMTALVMSFVFSVLGLILASIFTVIGFLRYNTYKKKFKKEVVSKIVALINPGYSYHAQAYIDELQYLASGLFPNTHDRYSGDDLITGIIDKTPFSFSEVKAEAKHDKNQTDDNKVMIWRPVFKGLFFVAEFNKYLNHSTFIIPEKTHTNPLRKEKTKVKDYGTLVKLENPEFESLFSVYSSSQQEARYVLTPKMMEALIHIQKTLHVKMYFSFIKTKVYCAIPMKKDMFEPSITTGLKYHDVENMYTLFQLIATIITEMNLNTRIWTKE